MLVQVTDHAIYVPECSPFSGGVSSRILAECCAELLRYICISHQKVTLCPIPCHSCLPNTDVSVTDFSPTASVVLALHHDFLTNFWHGISKYALHEDVPPAIRPNGRRVQNLIVHRFQQMAYQRLKTHAVLGQPFEVFWIKASRSHASLSSEDEALNPVSRSYGPLTHAL